MGDVLESDLVYDADTLWRRASPLTTHSSRCGRPPLLRLLPLRCGQAWKGDAHGNLVFKGAARNFNAPMAQAGRVTVAEVEEIVPVGTLNPDDVHIPGVYVAKIFKGEKFEKRIERLTVQKESSSSVTEKVLGHGGAAGSNAVQADPRAAQREMIVKRAAQELKDGMCGHLPAVAPLTATAGM